MWIAWHREVAVVESRACARHVDDPDGGAPMTTSAKNTEMSDVDWEKNPYLRSIADVLVRDGFEPRPDEVGKGSSLTLYEAVRLAGQLDYQHGLVRWANHHELREVVGNVYARLDWALGESIGTKLAPRLGPCPRIAPRMRCSRLSKLRRPVVVRCRQPYCRDRSIE